ncbi:peptide ABC transporter substrate-binding protein [uncultured Sphaerochaeta sp.]|uniref:peptide ABC transporter substrate-binding protein n=1 Tax=uncultured Sphaerochaeta sp. TaxID=886478 RepID=UPI002A0A5592|nr:peptide ABC transporter substrate-binding protein [uncultured Sphaerochaeta sp.]
MKKRTVLTSLLLLGCLSLFANGNAEKTTAATAPVQKNNTLNVMIEVEVESLDPQIATDGTSFEVIADYTDGLKQMAADGSVINALCADEQISPDGLTYTFKIRDDAYWSNGDPVTADDFVFGWQRAVDPDTASEYSYMMSDIGQLKNAAAIEAGKMSVDQLGVKAIDAKTLQVQLEVPVSYFDECLYFPTYYPVNRAFFAKCGDTFATSADTVLSNGAYILSEYEPAATSFKLIKNPKYYNAGKVKLDGLNYQVIKDSQQALMSYQNGDLDIIQLSGDQVDQVKDDPEFKSVGAGYLWYISPNIAKSTDLANLNLRMAMTFALDRETLAKSVIKDGSTAAFAAVPTQLATNSKGQDFTPNQTEFSDVCDFDTTKALTYYNLAKKELNKDSFKFEMIVDDTEIQQNVAAVLKEELEQRLPGLEIDLRIEPKKQRVQDMQDGTYTLGLTRWGPDYADPMTYLGMWVTGNDNNYGLWSDAQYDSLIAECTTGDLCTDPVGRWDALKKAETIVMKQAVIFPLYQQANADMIKSNVSGIEFHPIALNRVYKNTAKK